VVKIIDGLVEVESTPVSVSGNIVQISGQAVTVSGNAVYVYISGGGVSVSGSTVITSISGQNVTAEISGQSIVALDQTAYKTWKGKYYVCDDYVTMQVNDVKDWVILTSNQTAHMSFMFSTRSDYYITIHETPTVTSNGVKLTVANTNRISSVVTVTSIYTSSTVSVAGTQIEQIYIPTNTTRATVSQEYVLKQNDKYLVRIKSLANNNIINPAFYFYEGET